MEIKVLWTETALNNLEEIFEFYKYKESVSIARKLVKEIVKSTLRLQKFPYIGKKENLLADRKNEYRFIVVRHYKIIYWIEDSYIKIATDFDSRQNPEKVKHL
jgi:plasmid stabilization system protein ParE